MPPHAMTLAEAAAELRRRYGIGPISGGSENGDPPDDDPEDSDLPDDLGDAGKAALRDERKKRRDAAKRARAAEDELAAIKAAADKAKTDAERAEAAKRGEFDSVRAGIEGERDAAARDRDGHKARLDAAMAVLAPQVAEGWKALPKEVADLYAGDADDVLAKAAHLERTKALAARLAEKAAPRGGNPPGPDADDPGNRTLEDLKNEARRSGEYAF